MAAKKGVNPLWKSTPAEYRKAKIAGFTLPVDVGERLDAFAAETGHPKSVIVTAAIATHLRSETTRKALRSLMGAPASQEHVGRYGFTLAPDTVQDMDNFARKSGHSKSAIVSAVLDACLRTKAAQAELRRVLGRKQTMQDLIAEVVRLVAPTTKSELVAAVLKRRPGTAAPSIYVVLGRMRASGRLRDNAATGAPELVG